MTGIKCWVYQPLKKSLGPTHYRAQGVHAFITHKVIYFKHLLLIISVIMTQSHPNKKKMQSRDPRYKQNIIFRKEMSCYNLDPQRDTADLIAVQ